MLLMMLLALQTAATPVAAAASVTPPPAAAMAAQTSKDDRIVCHEDTHTGTRLSTRTCHTAREWRVLEDASAEWMRKQHALPCMGTGSCAGAS